MSTGTFHFDRHQKDFDGTTVSDVLDYYIPEWCRVDGRVKFLASGKTEDGSEFTIDISISRGNIARTESIDEYPAVINILWPNMPKSNMLTLSREGDIYDERTDKRYLMMMEDMKRKCG